MITRDGLIDDDTTGYILLKSAILAEIVLQAIERCGVFVRAGFDADVLGETLGSREVDEGVLRIVVDAAWLVVHVVRLCED